MPVITISRMYGSGGSLVAAEVAQALGWTLLDNAVLNEVAARLGLPVAEVAAREERPPSLVERLVATLSLGAPEALAATRDGLPPSPEERMLDVTKRVIEEVAQKGPAVLVGRGAQCMLATREDAMHVFCHAPREALVARVAARLGRSAAEAARAVEETNRQREQWVKRHWQRDWRAAANYHLSVDTAFFGISGAATLIVEVARQRFGEGSVSGR
ncbi:MAG: cytidylate kinase-like family protein [Gemmatimonadaceae bacterium]